MTFEVGRSKYGVRILELRTGSGEFGDRSFKLREVDSNS